MLVQQGARRIDRVRFLQQALGPGRIARNDVKALQRWRHLRDDLPFAQPVDPCNRGPIGDALAHEKHPRPDLCVEVDAQAITQRLAHADLAGVARFTLPDERNLADPGVLVTAPGGAHLRGDPLESGSGERLLDRFQPVRGQDHWPEPAEAAAWSCSR